MDCRSDTERFRVLVDWSAGPVRAGDGRLRIEFSTEHDGIRVEELEMHVRQHWAAKTSCGRFFNARKFRLAGVREVDVDGAEGPVAAVPSPRLVMEEDDLALMGRCTLLLGLTDYRSHLGTAVNPNFERTVFRPWYEQAYQEYKQQCGALPPKSMTRFDRDEYQSAYRAAGACTMGNSVQIETADGYTPFLRRSDFLLEKPSYYVLPGGHAEPYHIGSYTACARLKQRAAEAAELAHELSAGWRFYLESPHRRVSMDPRSPSTPADAAAVAEIDTEEQLYAEYPQLRTLALADTWLDEDEVVREFWNAPINEVFEETGIPCEMIEKDILLLGVVERMPEHRPCPAFYVKLHSTKAEVARYYEECKDRFESESIIWQPVSELQTRTGLTNFLARYPVPGDHIGALELYLRFSAAK